MSRNSKDALLQVLTAQPAAGASNNSASIDLGVASPGDAAEKFEVLLEVPALGALADTKTVTYKLQDSADNSSFSDIAACGTRTITGAGGVGAAATSFRWRLPSDVRRYIRRVATEAASGGDVTAVQDTLSLVF